MNIWAQLVRYSPERFEAFCERIYTEHGLGFKPVSINKETDEVEIELKDGSRLKEKI